MRHSYITPGASIRWLGTTHMRIQGVVCGMRVHHGSTIRGVEALEIELHSISQVGHVAHLQELLEVIFGRGGQGMVLPIPATRIHHSHALVLRASMFLAYVLKSRVVARIYCRIDDFLLFPGPIPLICAKGTPPVESQRLGLDQAKEARGRVPKAQMGDGRVEVQWRLKLTNTRRHDSCCFDEDAK